MVTTPEPQRARTSRHQIRAVSANGWLEGAVIENSEEFDVFCAALNPLRVDLHRVIEIVARNFGVATTLGEPHDKVESEVIIVTECEALYVGGEHERDSRETLGEIAASLNPP
jgi:hypothetical protein